MNDGHIKTAVVASDQGLVIAEHFSKQAQAKQPNKNDQAIKAQSVVPKAQPSPLGGRK
jgi:hypothetical protein